MAIYIKNIPTLKGRPAKKFAEKATQNEQKRASVDFSEQVNIARSIIMSSRLNNR